jgi:uroporphyrinogen III methyltransferase/synthase
MSDPPNRAGLVVLAGGGPGGAALVTAEAAKWLRRADTIVYDRLVGEDLLALAPVQAERVYVGKAPGAAAAGQQRIIELLIARARAGRTVVRLKGGDPFVFGRGGEEAAALAAGGVAFRVVPGVTAATAAAAFAGIPLTQRGIASSLALVTGHEDPAKGGSAIDWNALARIDTVVVYMGVASLEAVAERLIAAGRDAGTPAALVCSAASPAQRTVAATLATISAAARAAGVSPPAVLVVGPVAALRDRLAWFERLPLFGRCVLVTRPAAQAAALAEPLAELGAEVIAAPAIEIAPADAAPLESALRRAGDFDWLAVTSPNGVAAVFERLGAMGLDARALGGVRVAAVGPGTAAALRRRGIAADLVPDAFTTAALGEALCALPGERRRAILLARADVAGADLAERLAAAGWRVEQVAAYRTVRPAALPPAALDALRRRGAGWVAFTAASAVENFLALSAEAGVELWGVKLAALGPATARALAARGFSAAVTAEPHTVAALAAAIARHEQRR